MRLWTFISVNLRLPLILIVPIQFLVENWRIQGPKFLFFFVRIAVLIITISRIGTRKINGGAKFSEIKVQKTRVVMLVID